MWAFTCIFSQQNRSWAIFRTVWLIANHPLKSSGQYTHDTDDDLPYSDNQQTLVYIVNQRLPFLWLRTANWNLWAYLNQVYNILGVLIGWELKVKSSYPLGSCLNLGLKINIRILKTNIRHYESLHHILKQDMTPCYNLCSNIFFVVWLA